MINFSQLTTIFAKASDPAGAWSGTSPDVAKSYYDEIYNWGVASPVHYGIELIPFFDDSLIATSTISLYGSNELEKLLMRMKQKGSYTTPQQGDSNILLSNSDEFNVLPWLAQSISLNDFNAQVDSVQLGSQQLNFINGSTAPEITINFIETRNYAISNSLQAIKSIMFPKDGTQALPKDYLMRLKVYTFDRHIRAVRPLECNYVVAVQSDSLNLDATSFSSGMIIPVSFVPMFPNLATDNINQID